MLVIPRVGEIFLGPGDQLTNIHPARTLGDLFPGKPEMRAQPKWRFGIILLWLTHAAAVMHYVIIKRKKITKKKNQCMQYEYDRVSKKKLNIFKIRE